MLDPVTTTLIIAGAKKLGWLVIDWAKADPPELLIGALAGRIQENDFVALGFDSLLRDEMYVNLIADTRQSLRFDEVRATYIVRGHVSDIRSDEETAALVQRVVGLLRDLLPSVVGGREAVVLQTAPGASRCLDHHRRRQAATAGA